MSLTACREDALVSASNDDGEIASGEAVRFATFLPDAVSTRAAKDDWSADIEKYKEVFRAYDLTVEMWKKGASDATKSANYSYASASTTINPDDQAPETPVDDLTPVDNSNILYWEDNVSEWGFKATAGSHEIATDQNSGTKWLAQDKLEGYGYVPVWDDNRSSEEGYNGEYDLNNINFRSNKQWYADNKKYYDGKGLMQDKSQYKKIPLYLQHKRAWITIKLIAGEGVSREALIFSSNNSNIEAIINSYGEGNNVVKINHPWANEFTYHYPAETIGNLPEQNLSSTRYDAIVEPYDYATHKEKAIANITLSGQKFSFSAELDKRYVDNNNASTPVWEDAYNLTEGKHLTLEVVLSRESRKILITAWVEDWTEAITTTICDDYGNAGDPIEIGSKKELLQFLMGPDNKSGIIAIIKNRNMNLDEDGDWPKYVKDGETINGGSNLTLNATLNGAGAILSSKSQFVDKISSSGSILNTTFLMNNTETIPTAIANVNEGTLERITVTKSATVETKPATIAGLVGINYGTIYRCHSTLPVYGDGTKLQDQTQAYVGGIAALSIQKDASSRSIIDACYVNACVNGNTDVQGGGIVGLAAGLVTNNTFEYGITLSQNGFKNIFHTVQPSYSLSASNNAWPTTDKNSIGSDETTNVNVYAIKYDAVINSENELKALLGSEYNSKESPKSFRISENFVVNSNTWGIVNPSNDYSTVGNGNVFFKLNGNNKTITLTGTDGNENSTVELWDGESPRVGNKTETITSAPMLFNNIMGEIRDLTLYLDKPVVANPSIGNDNKYNANDAIAPLAYSVYGGSALISNVNVRSADNTYIQAATPAGLVVWALSNSDESRPTIENCSVEADVRMWLNYNYSSTAASMYSGGIVAMASKAIVTQCKYKGKTDFTLTGAVLDKDYKTDGEIYPANWKNCYYGGIVGGTTTKATDADGKVAYLSITDCSSWYATSAETTNTSRGSIIGIAKYSKADAGSTFDNGMAPENSGNWWPENSIGAANLAAGVSEEKAIGKRNSITPTF